MIPEDLEQLFNGFDTLGRNVNKQNSNLRATHFQQIHIFYYIFLHAWITILAVSHTYGSTFHYLNMLKM